MKAFVPAKMIISDRGVDRVCARKCRQLMLCVVDHLCVRHFDPACNSLFPGPLFCHLKHSSAQPTMLTASRPVMDSRQTGTTVPGGCQGAAVRKS